MGNRLLIILAAALMLTAPSGAQELPKKEPGIFAKLANAQERIKEALSSALPADKQIEADKDFFTRRFQEFPQQRGAGWLAFARLGKPLQPASSVNCRANSNDAIWNGAVNAAAAAKNEGKPAPYACDLLARCKALTLRASGCYVIEIDACIAKDGDARIDKLTGGSRYTERDFKTSATKTPCTGDAPGFTFTTPMR